MNDTPYPNNLIEEIFQERDTGPCDNDQLDGLEYAIATLSERERVLLLMYYRDGLTYDEIAKSQSVTRERVRQIVVKAIRKLRHPSRAKYITNGYAAMSGKLRRRVEERHKATLDALEAEYLAQINELREKISLIKDRSERISAEKEAIDLVADIDVPIEALNLSVRSYNCLMRRGIKTLYDICCLTYDELCGVRNLGRKSVEEIVERVHGRGYRLKGEQPPPAPPKGGERE